MRFERWRRAAAALVTLAAAGAPAAEAGRNCAISTRLEWIDVNALAPFAYGAMASEVTRTLADHGVCARVDRVPPSAMREDGEIAVILLRSMAGGGVGRRVMGATSRRDERNATVWVYFDEVASVLELPPREPEAWTAVDRFAFGRALGRVAAHEVIHALLPGRPHDRIGLMAPSFGRHALTAPALFTHPSLVADLRRPLAGVAARRSWVAAR
jgi:hypothetical protein